MYNSIYLCNKGDANSGVGTDQFDEDLSTDVPQQLLNMLPNEGVLHYSSSRGGRRGGQKRLLTHEQPHSRKEKFTNYDNYMCVGTP